MSDNSYVDNLMPELRKLVKEHGYDPASLPSGSVGFSKKINALFTDITVHGNAGYDNGRFHGLATLHRFSLLMSLYIRNGRVAKSDITTHHREIYSLKKECIFSYGFLRSGNVEVCGLQEEVSIKARLGESFFIQNFQMRQHCL